MSDPRYYQIAVLGTLLVYGTAALGFGVEPLVAGTILATALLTQAVAGRIVGIPFDPRSPLISSLSLCLLLRTNDLGFAALAAIVTIGSKFVIRRDGKHVFNPTNFGLVVIVLLGGGWVSPGQWGSFALAGFTVACLGMVVVNRAKRSDVTWAFLAFYVAILFGRAAWLGDPLAIPLHQIQSGALLIFAFFMISDPKTTPNSRAGRILFALLVALVAGTIRFGLFRPNDLLWALVICSPMTPLIDWLLPGDRYQWQPQTAAFRGQPKGAIAS